MEGQLAYFTLCRRVGAERLLTIWDSSSTCTMQSNGEKDSWSLCYDSFLPNNLEPNKNQKHNV